MGCLAKRSQRGALLASACLGSIARSATAQPEPSKSADLDQPTIEVVVQEERKPRDGSAMSQRASREVPGAFGDPFRTVESMPGVSGLVSGLPYFFVRGAPPGNVGYFLDGIRIPMLYHAFAGPSVIHPAFIDSVELHRGGYPASFGHYAGAIVEGRTVAPVVEGRGEANIRLFDAGAMVATPFASGRGSVMLGGRYSYTGLIISKLSDVKLDYWDYQALASYALSPKDNVGILAFGASDYSAMDNGSIVAGIEFHRLDLRSTHRFDDATDLRTSVTTGWDRSRSENAQYSAATRTSSGYVYTNGAGLFVRDTVLQGRASLSHRLGPTAGMSVGLDAALDRFQLETPNSLDTPYGRPLSTWYPTRNDYALGCYVEGRWSPVAQFQVLPGWRVDHYTSLGNHATAIEPRLATVIDVTSRIRVLHAFGISHQPPSTAPPGLPGVQQMAGLAGGLQRSYQASSGLEARLGWDLVGSVTAFDNVFTNLSDPAGNTGAFGVETADVRSISSAIGLEFSLRRPITRHLGGFVNYTWSRTTRSHGFIASPAAFERQHVGNLVLAYDLGARWRAGARLFYESGVPVREPTTDGPRYDASRRAPGFFRIDLRLEKRWRLGARGQISAVAEMLNATMSREVLRRNCNASGCRDDRYGPFFLPSVGVEARY
jgi:hypothetical protein